MLNDISIKEGFIPVPYEEYRLLVVENAENASTLAIIRRLAARNKYVPNDIKAVLGIKDGEQDDE